VEWVTMKIDSTIREIKKSLPNHHKRQGLELREFAVEEGFEPSRGG